MKYRRFIKQFESYVLRGVHHASIKLQLLSSSSLGLASEDIEVCIMVDSSEIGYLEAHRILETNNGQSYVVVDAYVRAITERPLFVLVILRVWLSWQVSYAIVRLPEVD